MSVLAELQRVAAPALGARPASAPGPSRFAGRVGDAELEFVLEAVYEGYLMHYGTARAFVGLDEDLRLLAGDALYALGLSRLASAGQIAAVGELSDLISLSAQAHAEGRPELAEPLWDASARALSAAAGPGARASAHGTLRAS